MTKKIIKNSRIIFFLFFQELGMGTEKSIEIGGGTKNIEEIVVIDSKEIPPTPDEWKSLRKVSDKIPLGIEYNAILH